MGFFAILRPPGVVVALVAACESVARAKTEFCPARNEDVDTNAVAAARADLLPP